MFSIHHEIDISGPRAAIMKAISTPDGINAWWTKRCSGRLLVGELFNFYFSDDYSWWAYVSEYVEDKKVAYEMCDADQDWNDTLLSFEIKPMQGGAHCRLCFEHSRWKEQNNHFHRTDKCWGDYFQNLKKYVETGERTVFTDK